MIIIIKFTYNVGSDWLEQNATSENRKQVHDFPLALKVAWQNLNIPFK